jgi:hypothetical protein
MISMLDFSSCVSSGQAPNASMILYQLDIVDWTRIHRKLRPEAFPERPQCPRELRLLVSPQRISNPCLLGLKPRIQCNPA